MVFGSNPAGLDTWQDDQGDLGSARVKSISCQFAQQWKLRMMVEQAALRGIEKTKLCRLSVRTKSFNCSGLLVGRKCARKWRGPAVMSDIDETGTTVEI